jgi:hydrogenase maturation protease
MTPKPVLLFAYGNLSRGDDALGPKLLEHLQQEGFTEGCGRELKYLTDYQMQVEHVMDMQHCERVLLIDAAIDMGESHQFYPVTEQLETQYTTHGMTPSTLLYTYRQTLQEDPPFTSMLAIRGRDFELGHPLSIDAENSLNEACIFIQNLLAQPDFKAWDGCLSED